MNFEANRRKILEDLRRQREHKKSAGAKVPGQQFAQFGTLKKNDKERIAIFAEKSLFLNNLVSSLSHSFQIDSFVDVDKAMDFIVEKNIRFVIIDIDPPSDYHQAANFLTVVKSLVAGAIIFVCTKDKNESRARTLFTHGGIIIEKPVSIPELIELMNPPEE